MTDGCRDREDAVQPLRLIYPRWLRASPQSGFVASGDPLRLLGVRPEGEADLHPAGRHAGEAAQTQPQALPPRTLLEVCRVGIQKGRTVWRHTGHGHAQPEYQIPEFLLCRSGSSWYRCSTTASRGWGRGYIILFINRIWEFICV